MSTEHTEKRLLRVWLFLSAITLAAWVLGAERGIPAAATNAAITYGAILIAAIKVRVIVAEFMEAGRVSNTVRLVMDTWLFVLVVGLSAIYAFKLEMPPV